MAEGVSTDRPVVLFDGVCNLCTGAVQFLIRRDPEGTFRFAPLQSSVGERLLSECDVDTEEIDSIVLVEGGECYLKADAVVRIGIHLGGVYRLLGPFRYLPDHLRNAAYDFVASRRYDWFGKREQCLVPSPEIESRFLAGGPRETPQSKRDP